jgi:hypothetical protein
MADGAARRAALQTRLRETEWQTKRQDAQQVAEDAGLTERAWLGVELPGHRTGLRAFVVVGEAVLLAVRTDEEAHQVAARGA